MEGVSGGAAVGATIGAAAEGPVGAVAGAVVGPTVAAAEASMTGLTAEAEKERRAGEEGKAGGGKGAAWGVELMGFLGADVLESLQRSGVLEKTKVGRISTFN